jgi:uncharacterized protein
MATQSTAVATAHDFFVPAFELKLKGRDVAPEVLHDVVSVTYEDSLDRLDSCQITLNNWDADRREFKYLDPDGAGGRFKPGTGIELSIGYRDRGGLSLLLRGQIVSLAPDFPADGQPTLEVRALNQLYRLHYREETAAFRKLTDTQIARRLVDLMKQAPAGRGSPPLDLQLEAGTANSSIEQKHEYLLMHNEFPILFLLRRARHNGYDLYVEEPASGPSKLHFHPPAASGPVYELKWGVSLVSFSPELSTKNPVERVEVRSENARDDTTIVGKATWSNLDPGLRKVAELHAADAALAGSEVVIDDSAVESKTDADQTAKDHLTELAHELLTASGTTLGLPGLRAGQAVRVTGVSSFSGLYRITASTHTIGAGGYTTRFDARMEEPVEAER